MALARAELAAGRAAQAETTVDKASRLAQADAKAPPSLLADIAITRAEISRARSRPGANALATRGLALCDHDACGIARYGLHHRAAQLER